MVVGPKLREKTVLPPSVTIGIRLRKAREAKDITQAALNRKLGLPVARVNQVEMGRLGMSATMLKAVCSELNVSPSYFVKGTEDGYDSKYGETITAIVEGLATHPEFTRDMYHYFRYLLWTREEFIREAKGGKAPPQAIIPLTQAKEENNHGENSGLQDIHSSWTANSLRGIELVEY